MKNILLFPSAVLLSACGALSPVKDQSVTHLLEAAIPQRHAITGTTPVIAVARPSLPGYIDRQQLVTRDQDGGIVMNSNQIWAETIDESIARVTAENLARIRNSLNIQPVQAFITIDYTHLLETRITRFDADVATRTVVLEASWKLQPVSGRLAPVRPFRTVVPIDDPEFTAKSPQHARVIAMNRALAEYAAAVARHR